MGPLLAGAVSKGECNWETVVHSVITLVELTALYTEAQINWKNKTHLKLVTLTE